MKYMLPLLLLLGFQSYAQIKNPGFESLLPHWTMWPLADFTVAPENTIVHSGRSAIKITRPGNPGDWLSSSFYQLVTLPGGKNESIEISAWIKTAGINGTVAISCDMLDRNGKQLAAFSSRMQGLRISGDNDWQKYTLRLLITSDISQLKISGMLYGSGTAWFDDFEFLETALDSKGAPSKAVKKYLRKTIGYVKKYSIYKDSLDWSMLEPALQGLSAGMQQTSECYPVIDYLLARLRTAGDNHSVLMRPDAMKQMSSATVPAAAKKPLGSFGEGGIGYIFVPGFASLNDTAIGNFATEIQQIIRDLDTQNDIKGWVIDLRENSGGNMYPMIAGLGPLCGEGMLGKFYSSTYQSPWKYMNGAAYAGKSKLAEVKTPYRVKNPAVKMAVLIGPKTASSGEMTAVSFSGRPGTRFFGEASGGFTTANGKFPLPDGATLFLANSFIMDRNLKKFTGKIIPDTKTSSKEKIPKEVAAWLLEK